MEKRFGKLSRLAASLAYSLQMILYMGIVLYAPALALEALTGISQFAAILSVGKHFRVDIDININICSKVWCVHFIQQ